MTEAQIKKETDPIVLLRFLALTVLNQQETLTDLSEKGDELEEKLLNLNLRIEEDAFRD